MSLLTEMAKNDTAAFQPLQSKVIGVFTRVLIGKKYSEDYIYYKVPSPWLQVKILKFLKLFPPIDDQAVLATLNDIINRIINNVDSVKDQNKNYKNALYCVLFESISLVIHLNHDQHTLQAQMLLQQQALQAKQIQEQQLQQQALQVKVGIFFLIHLVNSLTVNFYFAFSWFSS
jgi:AP-2 complex subunit alpha